MKIKYFAGGNRIATLEKIYNCKDFQVTEILIAEKEPYYGEYQKFAKRNKLDIVKVNKNTLLKKFVFKNEDILLSVGFRYIIPKEIFSRFKYAINIHPTLLPKYRGAYSGYAVIENGEKETGLTAHFITEEVDAGDIINQMKFDISICDTIDTVTKKLLELEPDFALETLYLIKEGKYRRVKQPRKAYPVYSKKRKPEDSRIDPNKPLIQLINKIRACSAKFPAYFELEGKKIR